MADPLRRLLLVESDTIIALSEAKTLRDAGYEVVQVSNGEEALRIVSDEAESIDLVLMDIDLGDGMAAAEEISRLRDLPIVFLSLQAEAAVVERAERTTNYGYVSKRAGATVLLASIRMAFRLHAANRDLVAGREALRRSEAQYRSLVENLDVGILIGDLDERLVYANPAAHAIFQTGAESLVGQSLSRYLDAENADIVAHQTQLRKRGIRSEYDFEIVRADGVHRKVTMVATPHWDEGGAVVGALAIIRDITDIRAAEDALKRSESQYRELVANLDEGICIVDEDDRFIIANAAAHRIFGVADGALPGERLDSFLDEANRVLVARENDLRRRGQRGEYQMDIIARGGAVKRLSVVARPRVDERGGFLGTFAIVRDLSDLERMKSERQDLERHYQFIFENASAALLEEDFSLVKARLAELTRAGVADLAGFFAANPEELERCAGLVKVLDCNTEYRELIGFDTHERVVSSPLTRLGSYAPKVFAAELCELHSGKTSFEGEIQIRRSPVETTSAKLRLLLAPGHETDWSRVIVSIMDITAEKRIQAELSHSLEQKSVLMRELEHRIKNNLNIISSLLSLESGRLADQRSRQTFSDMESRIRSISLIYQLLSHTAGMDALDCKPYIEELLDLTRETYGLDESRISLEMDLAPLTLDTKRAVSVGLILNELVTNAIKYAFPAPARGRIRTTVAREDGAVLLTVEDDGVGLDPSFDWRASDCLGFQLVNMLTEQMGGSMELHADSGLRVEVRFPLSEERR